MTQPAPVHETADMPHATHDAEAIRIERMPEPSKKPIVGNMLSVDKDAPLQDLMRLTRELGGIFRLDMMGTPLIVVSDSDIVDELCDETRFDKAVRGALRRVRAIGGDGLFTGDTHDPNWAKAHHILLPTFSRQAMANYMPMMLDVANQLVTKWERLNADDEIDVVHDMTAVALDTIGICGFDYRFNSFYRRDYHPFIDALTHTLETCMMQRGLPFEDKILHRRISRMEKDVAYMNGLVDHLIAERRKAMARGDEVPNDLMSYMLNGVDPKTGEQLSDENIRYQINTFLIAGHETTSGLMSFTLYFLLNHPDVLAKAYEEVDRVLGRDISQTPTLRQVNQLQYVSQILYEALRLYPTAPAFGLYPYEDEVVAGKYKLKKGTFITVLGLMLHRDPKVWGDDPEAFDPDRFAPEEVAKRPVNAYKPFGNGQRACIGRQFAMQEAVLVMGMILQRFDLVDHTDYQLKIKESLSIKPDGFFMKVKMRPDVVRSGRPQQTEEKAPGLTETAKRPSHGTQATVLYGSNLGTTEEYARQIARSADLNGFDVTLGTLDSSVDRLPKSGVVLIATASYNGTPPDNAGRFVDWLKTCEPGSLEGVSYAVLGLGHSDWAATYQTVPRAIDEAMAAAGAARVIDRAEADAKDDPDEQFVEWFKPLWPQVGEALGLDVDFGEGADQGPLYAVEFLDTGTTNPLVAQVGAKPVTIEANRELQTVTGEHASDRSTRHVAVSLAAGQSYRTGDHLSVVPRNPPDLVRRVETRFGLASNAMIRLSTPSADHASLPVNQPIALRDLLFELIELQSPASRRDVEMLARYTECPRTKPVIERLAGEDYKEKVGRARLSVLDIAEAHPACEVPFEAFLETCPNMVPRYYSISSSPLVDETKCTITVAVVSGERKGLAPYQGVCSNYLFDRRDGDTIHAAIRQPSDGFVLPEDPATPIIMVGPGTGIAPFRGFCQEREALREKGETLGDAMLFFGCRHPEQDFIYEDELKAWDEAGVCELHVAFSRQSKERVYVQDKIREERARVWELLENGAKFFVCGDGGRMEPDVQRALIRICAEERDIDEREAESWMEEMLETRRYVRDVWVGG